MDFTFASFERDDGSTGYHGLYRGSAGASHWTACMDANGDHIDFTSSDEAEIAAARALVAEARRHGVSFTVLNKPMR